MFNFRSVKSVQEMNAYLDHYFSLSREEKDEVLEDMTMYLAKYAEADPSTCRILKAERKSRKRRSRRPRG